MTVELQVLLLLTLTVLSTGMLVYWGVALGKLVHAVRRFPTLRDALGTAEAKSGEGPRLLVIVPAHDEERCIEVVSRALVAQDYPNFSAIFVLDRCKDRTAEILRGVVGGDSRFRIVEIDQCPDGWVGKCNALHQGVLAAASAAATGSAPHSPPDVYLFLDADTQPAPQCLRAAVAALRSRTLDMLSVISELTYDRWFERVAQPAAGIELFRRFPIHRANSPTKRRAFANGQFIMVRREAYEKIGGHTAVKNDVLEDVWLARRLTQSGASAEITMADGLLRCRMYDSWARFHRGWLRIFGESASHKPGRLRGWAWQGWVTAIVLPLAAAGAVVAGAVIDVAGAPWAGMVAMGVGIAGLVLFAVTLTGIWRVARVPLWTVLLYPIGAAIVGKILYRAARDAKHGEATVWGGRVYERPKG